MDQLLKVKQKVKAETSGMTCEVERYLGEGGQGEVYGAVMDGKPVALKWYFPHSATKDQRLALENIIKKGPPSTRFLWPMELVSAPGVGGFGYIMPLRPQDYKGIDDLMKRHVEPTFKVLATAGLNLVDSFLQLHSMGLCYRDISFGNVFFDPQTGEVLICDNDNVAIDGETKGGVSGTPRFMAPEIVLGKALPSTKTDLFSLSILLFHILVMNHPFNGKKEAAIHSFDPAAMYKLYGKEPIFIFDPCDDSNRPVPGYHDNAFVFWPIYPNFLRNLFIRVFTEGVRDPLNSRVRESEWRIGMVRLRDSIIYCSLCGMENFYDSEALKASGSGLPICWSCKKKVNLPPRIRMGTRIIMLNYDTQLYSHHIDDRKSFDFSKPVATVIQHPTDPRIWGLKNLLGEKWVATTFCGKVKDIEPGRSIALATGTKINFGRVEGEIRF